MALLQITKQTDTKVLERIAAALEKIADLYQAEMEEVRIFVAPKQKVDDPIEDVDVVYSDPQAEYIEEFKQKYKLLSDEEKKAFIALQSGGE